jgi:ATP-binding cassette subfamily B protein
MFLIIKRKSIVSTSYLLELLSSVETIKNLNIYNKVSNKLNEKYLDYTKELKKYNLFYNKFELLKSVTSDTMFIFSIMISSLLVFKGRISIYDLVLFESIFYTFSGSLKDLLDNVIISKNYQVGIDRVLDLYDVKEEKTLDNKITSFNSINISNLNFSYDDKKIFNNLNLKIKRGDKILFVGKSGSGKTTLIHLLLKYFNNYQGKIEIDGTNLKKIDSFSIRNVVGYVSQNEKLYSDTIYNNLTLGGTYINNIDEVCNISKVNEFLKNKNITMDYYLDKESSNLSGGEKKRLMLARVLLKNNSILILDEVFNEIDIKMEKEILENLFKAYKNKTIIVISHRDTNYKLFDKYWKINNYKIMEGESYEKIK